MEMTGCGPREAADALSQHKEIWLAIDALMPKPVVSGEKYIPVRPAIDSGLTAEQKERCDRGRWLQDKVNAVFSVAHSQVQTQPDPAALEAPRVSQETTVPLASSSHPPSSEPVSLQGTDEKSSLPTRQS